MKLASMQKVDLLAASRCNMLSQVLAAYQDTLLQTMVSVSESFKGYQYYEFSLLKELTPTVRKLAQETSNAAEDETENESSPESEAPPINPSSPIEPEESVTAAKDSTNVDKKLDSLFPDDLLTADDSLPPPPEGKNDSSDLLGGPTSNEDSEFLNDILSLGPLPPTTGSGEDKTASAASEKPSGIDSLPLFAFSSQLGQSADASAWHAGRQWQ
ncbi:unnamed protein product [Dibothriocephalus latus]|uniref:AH domain-containing protein n=1 Tax=Dibothriocephalus latus TaxID=60516 RepID=A0A3P7MZ21_DIBLA|nr:unnamed protein product [Dibothriocephalus latus]